MKALLSMVIVGALAFSAAADGISNFELDGVQYTNISEVRINPGAKFLSSTQTACLHSNWKNCHKTF
jgi:hypothetical protein